MVIAIVGRESITSKLQVLSDSQGDLTISVLSVPEAVSELHRFLGPVPPADSRFQNGFVIVVVVVSHSSRC